MTNPIETGNVYKPCPICKNGKWRANYSPLGLKGHLQDFHHRLDWKDLLKLVFPHLGTEAINKGG